jgi:hypothetical protein
MLNALPRIWGNTGASAVTSNAYLILRVSVRAFNGVSIAQNIQSEYGKEKAKRACFPLRPKEFIRVLDGTTKATSQ